MRPVGHFGLYTRMFAAPSSCSLKNESDRMP
jgi:hypothetical protein